MLESVWNVNATAHAQQNGVKHDIHSFQLSVTESFVLFIGSLKLVSIFFVCQALAEGRSCNTTGKKCPGLVSSQYLISTR